MLNTQWLRSMLGLALALISLGATAQISGSKNIPGDYATLADAITDLNTVGVGAGGVTLNLLAGNPQTTPAGGYAITATGTLANPITVACNGNTITAFTPQTSGNLNDAIFKLIGSDFVTINGCVMTENAANTSTTAGTNNMTEWGIALLYASTTDGAQNATLQGNTITLNRTYQNTFGIYSNSTHTATAVTTSATATTSAGGNSGLKIYGNTISNVNVGIVVVGPTAAADNNEGVDIGGVALATGNSITNYGTTGTFSGYVNVSGTVNGILVRNTRNYNVSFNTVTSSVGGVTAGTLNGILIPSFSIAPTGTLVNSINNNSISLKSGVAGGAMNGISVQGTTVSTTTTLNINNNNFSDSGHTVAGSAAIQFIVNAATTLNTNINNNTFSNLSVNTTGNVTFISNSVTHPAGAVTNVNNNSIVGTFAKTGAGGTVRLYDAFGSTTTGTETNTGNNFSNITLTGATTFGGWRCADGATPFPAKTVTNNTFSNIVAGTAAITVLDVSFSPSSTITGNLVSSITGGTGTAAVVGITSSSGTQLFESNTVHTITASTTSNVSGISLTGGTAQTLSRNKVYNIENTNAAPTSASGILVSGGTTINLYNNLVGDIRAPNASAANAAIGINITGGTTVNAAYNTVRLQASSVGANFGSSALSAATGATVALNNNALVNLSTAAGTGLTVAYRRSSTTLTSYASSSNNNDFFAGTPSATNLIYFDGTNSDQTLAAYKARVATRDSASVSENPPFLSTTGSSATFLHIDPAVATQLESGGAPFAGVTVDFDGDARNASTPDIGADEFNGVALDLNGPTISYALLGNTTLTSNRTLNATISDPSGVASGANAPRVYFRKNAGTYFSTQCSGAGPAYACTIDNALIGGVAASDVVDYFVIAQDTAGNVSGNPGAGLVAANVNTVSTPPTTPNTYTIVAPFPTSVNVGVGETYTSLTNAGGLFEAINGGVLTANVSAQVTSDLVGETGGVALNPFSENGVGGYTLTIRPSAASERLIVGAAAGGLIRLNGADRVIFDGRFGGSGRFLRVRNTASGAAFLFLNDATLNTVASSIVESANTGATSGTIFFSTSTGTLGNSGNEIRDCELRDRSDAAGVPANAVYSNGSAGAPNTSNSVLQSSVYNYIANGVLVAVTGAGNGWTVADNSFFQTAARTTALSGVTIAGGSGHSVTGNSIGGGAVGAGGAFLATSGLFNGINLTVGTTPATSVQGNVVKNIRSTSTSFTASYGIWVQAGTVNVGNVLGNYIGSVDPNERFEINGDSYGIRVVSTTAANVSNNTVNNMTTGPTVPTGEFYFGIAVEGVAGAHTVQNNLVTNFTNGSTPDASFNTQTIGMIVSATGAQTIRGNTIDTIGNTSVAAVAALNNRVWGTILSGTGVGTVFERNRIVGVYASSPTTGARADVVTALQVQTLANATLVNNMVSVSGGAVASDRSVFGILDLNAAGATANYYFNSVNVHGTATTANNSFAFNRNGVGTVVLRNNIFANVRSGGTGFHVAMANSNAAATGWSATASDYNLVFNATPAHVTQWLGSAAINNLTLADFRTASGGDANSLSGDPLFVSNSDLHIGTTSAAVNVGTPFGGVNVDFDLEPRSATAPEIGADELPTYTVGGNVTGLAGTGLVLQNNLGDDLPVSSNGSFTFSTPLSPGAAYSVTVLSQPGGPTQTCVVTSGSGTIVAANVTDVAVNCTTNTYTVTVSVSGLTGTGLVLRNNGGDDLPISGNGGFTFATPVASGANYAVTVFVQPSGPAQFCGVTNGNGTIGAANVTNVTVACSNTNTAPTIAAVGVTRRAGDAAAVATIANVTDAEDALNTLAVTVNGGATATVNNVTVNGISTSVAGVVSANVIAACGATSASFTLRVTDSGALFNESTLNVTVNPNLAPTLTYAAANAVFGQNLSVNPATGPSDSGSISSIVVQGAGTYTGGVAVNNGTGVVSLTSAAPVGSHTIVIRATDNCLATTDANLSLTVGQGATTTAITADTPDPTFAGESFTVSYTVTANAPGAGTPAGNVTVGDGVDSCTATVVAGQCSLALSTPGVRTLTATYAGNASFAGSAGTASHTVSPTSNLSISKTVNDALIGTGVIQYTITVANAGPSPVTGATVVDNFPAAVTGVSWTCAGTGGGTCSASGSGNINQSANMPVGATVVYSISGSVALPLPNSISNTATVAAPVGTTDPNTANNTSTAVAVIIFFRNGFEDGGVAAPVAEKLQFAANGGYARLQLPIGDIAALPVDQEPVEVIRFALANSLVVVQTRRLGDLIQVRSLQVNADRSWTAGNWTSLDSAAALYFEWAAGAASQSGAQPISRLRTQQ